MTRSTQVLRAMAGTGLAALLAAATTGAGAPTPAPVGTPAPVDRSVVVTARQGRSADLPGLVRAAGGTVGRRLPLVDGVSARVPADRLDRLAADPAVRSVTPDASMTVTGASWGGSPLADTYPRSAGADAAWRRGSTGAGVTVAVLDTGVSPVDDLAGRVVAGPDLSGEGDSTRDSYGHGTVMAGIVAGDGSASRGAAGGAYVGMAPQARVVSIKVAGRSGASDVSTVLAALQWVGTFHDRYGIRVLNLSWGTRSHQATALDPLDFAVERLWAEGVVVVVSAGNTGPADGTVTKPGDDPAVLTVGAYDEGRSSSVSDDVVAGFSGRGSATDGKPDLVAPGRTLISTVAPGSAVAQQHPEALVGAGYIKGSGTSQATAATSGAVALLLSARPDLTPDQVKHLLRSTAAPLPLVARTAQGNGELRLGGALDAPAGAAPQQVLLASGVGSLEASRGGRHVSSTCRDQSPAVLVMGERDTRCRTWSADSWSADSWSADSWSADSWSADSWSADSWSADSWSADSWSADSWSADSWSSASWGDADPASAAPAASAAP